MSTVKSVRFEDDVIETSNEILDIINNGWIPSQKVSFSSLLNEGLIEAMWNKIRGYLPYCETSHPRKFPVIDKNGNIRLIQPSDEERHRIFTLAKKILTIKILNDDYFDDEERALIQGTSFDEYVFDTLGDYIMQECEKYDNQYPNEEDVVLDAIAINEKQKEGLE